MDAKTLKALRASIAHWIDIRDTDSKSIGGSGCALCRLFNYNTTFCCKGCPVSKRSGAIYCRNTPYSDYVNINHQDEAARVAAAQAEIDFLISLLPEGELP